MIEKPEFTAVNEDFEITCNAAGAENMNRATVSVNNNSVDYNLSGPQEPSPKNPLLSLQ